MNNLSIPFIPYGRQTVTESDIRAVVDTLRSPFLTQGPVVPAFEKAFAKRVTVKHGVAVNSATSALHIACLSLGVTSGDIVWTSPITFVASANCALYCGANVDFVDIDAVTGLIDIKKLEIKLANAEKNNSLPKVLIPVHLAGSSCDMNKIYSLSKKYSFSIIEDASHAIGGKYENQSVGNCKYSAITVFSFHPVKIITTGEGGLLTTNKNDLAEKIRMLRSHGIVRDKNKFQYSTEGSWKYEQQLLGFNYRMTDLQAALGLSQLNRLDEIVIERNRQLKFYYEILKDLPLTHLIIPENVVSSVHLAVIKLKKVSPQYYLDVFEGMRSEGIGVQLHYIPIYKQPYFSKFNFEEKNFPGSEEYSSTAISIPIFPGLKEKEQLRVRDSLKKFL